MNNQLNGIKYFDEEWAIAAHINILNVGGGLHLDDKNVVTKKVLLSSILSWIKDDEFYPLFIDKLTHLVFSIAKGHCFADGNKRTAIVLGSYFLKINSYDLASNLFMIAMEDIVLLLSSNIWSKDNLRTAIEEIINDLDFSEATQLNIFRGMEQYRASRSKMS